MLALPRAGSLAQRADRAAVVKLYHLLNGPWWHRNANWDVDKGDPCAYAHDHNLQEPWDGIHCLDPCSLHIDGLECYSGRITVIHLERNNLTGSITNWTEVMPPQFANLKSLKYLYLQNEHYWPLRHFYCRQRLPKATWGKGGTKYNWVVVAQMYETMTTSTVQGDRRCIDPHDTTFAFNSLQDSGVLAMG